MQSLRVNGYDMAYFDVGEGRPLVCVHGTLGDFRTFFPVMGPLSKQHHVIAVSLRHFFPEHWDGVGDGYKVARHVADVIAFIEQMDRGPVDLMGHSRGGHIAFRVAQHRPDLLRKLVLAEPGGDLDASLLATGVARPASLAGRMALSVEKLKHGDVDGALQHFFEGIEGDGSWAHLPAAAKQQLRDNACTLLGQLGEDRKPYSKADAQAITTPALFIAGANTKGSLPMVLRALSLHVAGARTASVEGASHWMFEQAPQRYCQIVMRFLAG